MTPLPIDPARCAALSRGIEQLVALSGCDTTETVAVLLAMALDRGSALAGDVQAQLVLSVSGAFALAAKPRFDA